MTIHTALKLTVAVTMLGTLSACSISKSKAEDKEEKKESAPALADDAVVGSCQAKDNSFCEEYRNSKVLKEEARNLDLQMSKGACELKDGVWRDAKACEPKGEIGHCNSERPNVLKQVRFKYAGDEMLDAELCKDLQGTWESGLADDVVLGSCSLSSSCTELRNNKKVDADSRTRAIQRETESCERLESKFEPGKACQQTDQARAKCTKKGESRLTEISYQSSADKETLALTKESCDIGEGTFETFTPSPTGAKKKK